MGELKVIGFSAGVVGREGNVDRMVKAVLDGSGHDVEFVKLADMNYTGCKSCVHLCARPQACQLDDDLLPYYEKIKEADAVVIGSPVIFSGISGQIVTFIERFFGYRHVSIPIAGKPFIGVVGGAMSVDTASEQLRGALAHFEVNLLDVVTFQSRIPPCFKCGRHKECEIGGLYMMLGDAAKELTITPEMFAKWEDDDECMASVKKAADTLKNL